MKLIRIFGVFFVLHVVAWGATHFYLQQNRSTVLMVVDTSYAMKQNFPVVKKWIDNYHGSLRYKELLVGTDKAMLGDINELRSTDIIFRTSFGKLNTDNLTRLYRDVSADTKLLLSDGSLEPAGWQVVSF